MSEPGLLPPGGNVGSRPVPSSVRAAVRTAAALVMVMALAGAVLGLVWHWWSPPGPRGYVIGPGMIQPDETEAFIAGDGRFAVIVVASGVIAALAVWFARILRGAPAVIALALGGLAGAVLTDLVGHVSGGGTSTGKPGTVIGELELSVHMRGLLLVEAAAAVLVYGLCVSFATDDDLGEPDPLRQRARTSVRPDVQLQHARSDSDRPGGPQQGGFPPQ